MRIEVVTVGDELLLGQTIDTNGAHIARELAAIGIDVVRRTSVGDHAREIADAVGGALDRTGAVITTGGLGPTADDLTKQSVARLFGSGAVRVDETLLAQLAERWRSRFGTELPAANRRQVEIPEGARVLPNRHGSAPGIWLEDDRGRWVAMLPGVPREMRGMLADTLLPLLRERLALANVVDPPVIRARTVRTTGIPESVLPERLGDLARGLDGLSLAYLPGYEGVDLRLTSRGLAAAAADAALDAGARCLRARVAGHAYGDDDTDLAAVVLERCRAAGLTIAVAESCTGGLLGARLTAIPGSSDVMLGGVIAYANEVKVRYLGVAADDLAAHGAVSELVVRQMARGARERFDASIGVGITGIAGPGGGSPEKPVGTVWVGVDLADRPPVAVRAALIGDRTEIRQRATQLALAMVHRALGEPASAG